VLILIHNVLMSKNSTQAKSVLFGMCREEGCNNFVLTCMLSLLISESWAPREAVRLITVAFIPLHVDVGGKGSSITVLVTVQVHKMMEVTIVGRVEDPWNGPCNRSSIEFSTGGCITYRIQPLISLWELVRTSRQYAGMIYELIR